MLTKHRLGTWVTSIAMSATCIVGIEAQGAKASAIDKLDGKQQTVTVTGCLQEPARADEYALSFGPEKEAGAAKADTTFRLTNAMMKTGRATRATYSLIDNENHLWPHVGHQVQIMGTLVATARRGPAGEVDSPRASEIVPTVCVESVRMLSAECSQRR
jgi:hypothetical protein